MGFVRVCLHTERAVERERKGEYLRIRVWCMFVPMFHWCWHVLVNRVKRGDVVGSRPFSPIANVLSLRVNELKI